MYEHLRTWTDSPTDDISFRLDLWDTGRTRNGKSELRYCLAIIPGPINGRPVLIEGEQFWPSPLDAIDSDSTAAALLGFLAYDGEAATHYLAPPSLDSAERLSAYSARQREALAAHHELLSLWQYELDPDA